MDHDRVPKPGKNYPQTWSEFLEQFHSEDACLDYLERIRWPSGFVCPRCGVADDAYRATRSRLVCPDCQYQCSVTAGTIFDKARMPLRVWFAAARYITSQKHGVSALGMKRVLGLGSYQTACNAAPVPHGYGESGSRKIAWHGRGRRELYRHHRQGRQAEERDRLVFQGLRDHRDREVAAERRRSHPASTQPAQERTKSCLGFTIATTSMCPNVSAT